MVCMTWSSSSTVSYYAFSTVAQTPVSRLFQDIEIFIMKSRIEQCSEWYIKSKYTMRLMNYIKTSMKLNKNIFPKFQKTFLGQLFPVGG